jgi:hypothetical protein
MQVGDSPSSSPIDDGKRPRNLRKSNRIHDAKSTPTSSPIQRTKEEELPSPTVLCPGSTDKKRLASLEEVVNEGDSMDVDSPTDIRSPRSATSHGSGEPSPHICLCQPEPKIPRPRNGESPLLCPQIRSFVVGGVTLIEQRMCSLLVGGGSQPLTPL